MKLHRPNAPVMPRIGKAKRFNFYVTQDILDSIATLKNRAKKLKITPSVFTVSFILREGARLYVKQKNAELAKIERAEYHAKKRK